MLGVQQFVGISYFYVMKRISPVFAFFCLNTFISCNFFSHPEPDPGDIAGGPCSYNEYRIPARIVVFEVYDSISIDVSLKLDPNEFFTPPDDTISFFMEKGRFMTMAEADSLHLKKGAALTYLVKRIKSGDCTPEINTLLMEPME